jgi:hypothetical protein
LFREAYEPECVGEEEAKIIAVTLEAPEDETHWSARRLAKKVKTSKSTIQRSGTGIAFSLISGRRLNSATILS